MAEVVRIDGFGEAYRRLGNLPSDVVGKRGGPALRALRKGARVIDKARRANLRRVTSNATESGERESTGFLLKALSLRRGNAPQDGKGERVVLSVRKKVYARASGEAVSTLATALWTEFGTEKRTAEPWLRPAFNATAQQAIATVSQELLAEIDKLAR